MLFLSIRRCGRLLLASRTWVFVGGYSQLIDAIPNYSWLWAAILSSATLFLGICGRGRLFTFHLCYSQVFVAVAAILR
jgi:hypothetical protein